MNEDNIGCIIYVVVVIVLAVLSVGLAYWIGTSNLPDWMKLWLLTR